MNRVLRRWFARRPARRPKRAVPDWVEPAPLPAEEDSPPKGCAWYDSSLDLRRGLVVRECPLQIVPT